MKKHESPQDLNSALAMLPKKSKSPVVFTKAQYSPDYEISERIFLFAVRRNSLKKILDIWLGAEDIPNFIEIVKGKVSVFTGSCDAMYATSPKFVWAKMKNDLHVWLNGSLRGIFTPETVTLRRAWGVGWKSAPIKKFGSCYAFLSPTWVIRGVKMTRPVGVDWIVAQKRDVMAVIDPTYDGLDLLGDTCWVLDIAEAIADATGLPFKKHKDLV